MKTLNFLNTLLICLCFFSCSSNNEKKNDDNLVTSNVDCDFSFKKLEKKTIYHINGDTSKPFIDLKISTIIPFCNNLEDVNYEIQEIFAKQFLPDTIKCDDYSAADSFWINYNISNFKADYSNSDEFSVFYDYSNEIKQDILDSTENFITLHTFQYVFSGGAHGYYSSKYLNLIKKSLKVIYEKDLFKVGYEPELSEIIMKKLIETYKVSKAEDLLQQGFLDIENIKPNENFYITSKGITYVYNPYEIACYAMGAVSVSLPYEEIEHLLKIKIK